MAVNAKGVIAVSAAIGCVVALALIEHVLVRSGPSADAQVILPAVLSIAIVAAVVSSWPKSRKWLAQATAALAAVSLLAALVHRPHSIAREAFWVLTFEAALLLQLVLTFRWATARAALLATTLCIPAGTLTLLRVTTPTSILEAAGVGCTWALLAACAVGSGLYLRGLDSRRARMVIDARRSQRLELAHDLHDFIAHDVTGMVVRAQAARVVASRDPDEAMAALRGIEEAGLHALGSLDRTVHTLRDDPAAGMDPRPRQAQEGGCPAPHQLPGIEDLFLLVGRFAGSDGLPVHLALDPVPEGRVSREISCTAYRVVQEALTNVRRHAPRSRRVEVRVAPSEELNGRAMLVSVTNTLAEPGSGGGAGSPSLPHEGRLNGLGLVGLDQRVQAVGGQFAAGPLSGEPSGGWRVTAVLPLREEGRR